MTMNIEKKALLQKLRGDIIVVAAILFAALATFGILLLINDKKPGSEVIILQNGEETGRYDLSTDETITVHGADDEGYNLILISEGKVKVTDADCPDKLCVRQKAISRNGESIICLPHKLVIMIEAPEESDLDAVTN